MASSTGNLFDLLFPTESQEIAAVAARVGAPNIAPDPHHPVVAVSGSADASGVSTVSGALVVPTLPAVAVPSTGAAGGGGVPWAIPPTPAALAALYLARHQPGQVQWVNEAVPLVVPSQGSVTHNIPADPLGQAGVVWIPLTPIVLQAARHTRAVTAALTVDTVLTLSDYPLVHDAEVLDQMHAVIRNQIQVTLRNTGWRDTRVTVLVNAAAVEAAIYRETIAPVLASAAQTAGVSS